MTDYVYYRFRQRQNTLTPEEAAALLTQLIHHSGVPMCKSQFDTLPHGLRNKLKVEEDGEAAS
jgi:hypothetical protein